MCDWKFLFSITDQSWFFKVFNTEFFCSRNPRKRIFFGFTMTKWFLCWNSDFCPKAKVLNLHFLQLHLCLIYALIMCQTMSLAAPTLPPWVIEMGGENHGHSHDGPELIGIGPFLMKLFHKYFTKCFRPWLFRCWCWGYVHRSNPSPWGFIKLSHR